MSEPFDEFREPTLLDVADGDAPEEREPEQQEGDDTLDRLLGLLADFADGWLDSLPTEYPGDREWYGYCLRVMARSAGVDEDTSTSEVAVLLLDVCVVAAITQEFHYIVDSGSQSGDWQYKGWGDVVVSRDPSPAILLGMAVAKKSLSSTVWEESSDPTALVQSYVLSEWARVLDSLTRELGENYLFVGLWGARSGLGDPHAGDTWQILNAPTEDALVGWQWLQNDGRSPAY